MNVSDFMFKFFEKKGINTVFMLTGGQAMFLNDAVARNNNFKVICTHHEQTTTMSADAYGRITNKPSIALVTAGPGAVNAMTGVAGGYTDSAPMIVVSGQAALPFVKYQENTNIRQYGIQGINIKPLVEKITKYFVTIDDPQKIEYYLEKAYHLATTGRPGPVWLEVPLDIQRMEVNEQFLEKYSLEEELKNDFLINDFINCFLEKLSKAKRPLLIVGQGIKLSGATKEFREVLEKLNIPVVTSRLGIDLIESSNDLYIGRPGNYGERAANFAIQNSDLILSIGSRLSSSTVGHDAINFGKNAMKFVVDIDQEELNKPGVKIDHKLKADAKEVLIKLLIEIESIKEYNFENWIKQCNNWKIKYPVVLPEYKTQSPINSYYFLNQLSNLSKKEDAILVDTGSCFHVACQTWKVKKGQNFLTTGGLSSMGYWVAAIGACMANDKKNTIVVTGDGSLQMNIQEFAVIKHNKLPIKTFILNNNGYLLIRNTQRNFMEDRFIGESPESGIWCPDSLEIAKAYGIKGIRIDSINNMEEKIKEVLEYDGPVICDVMVQEWQVLQPRVSSEKLADGTLVSRKYEDMFPFLSKEEYEENMIAEKK
ncbi:thiamine pyrophosphate-binding protein [Cetobacterium sp.]|uniref:thiamine pyrophosphate-binding protein n=1 Tax=Cetobacterium sp. TaxID=2071632 RepID=UPI0025BBD1E6|nr:thiamine pyrophosphate-binding protein [Cetobacterium sp.]